MARKPNTSKTESPKSVLSDINKTVNRPENEVENVIEIDPNELIGCTSITFGELIYVSKATNMMYKWHEFGDEEYISFKELEQMFRGNREFVTKPHFIIQDERVIEKFRLVDKYSYVAQIMQLEKALQNDVSKASAIIDSALEADMRDVVISRIRDMRRRGTLTNIDALELIKSKIGIDLSRSE